MRADKDAVARVVARAIDRFNATLPDTAHLATSPSTRLASDGGTLSSLDLISLILAVEEAVNESFTTQVVLFDETLIADPNGPFRTLGDLVTHVHALVQRP